MQMIKPTVIALAIAACFNHVPVAQANPQGATVVNGGATFATQGNALTVTNTPGAIIHWQQFNIGAQETTRFIQQSSQSSVLNRVVGADPSQIHGQLLSNGQVYLINPNGILFGPNAFVDVTKLVASTLNLTDSDFLAKRLSFGGGGLGGLLNQGRITTPLGGSVYLIGNEVRNEGVITTPAGQVVLAAGNSVDLVDTAGPELSVTVQAAGNRAINLGTVSARGGRINMFGALIDQQGVLSADSASVDVQGRIVLRASEATTVAGRISATHQDGVGGDIRVLGDQIRLTSGAELDASGRLGGGTIWVGGGQQGKDTSVPNASGTEMQSGARIVVDATERGDGGRAIVFSRGLTDFKGDISARGGLNGGNGGFVETSGAQILFGGRVDTSAPKGLVGQWLIDPRRLCIYETLASECSSGSAATFNGPNTFDTTTQVGTPPQPLDTLVAASTLTAPGTTASISLFADELISILPAGGVWNLPLADGVGLSLSAPVIFLNGTIRNIPGQVPLAGGASFSQFAGLSLFASGVSGTGFAPDLGNAGSIIFGSGARLESTSPTAYLSMNAENFSFSPGVAITFNRQPDNSTNLTDYSFVDINALSSTSGLGPGQFASNGLTIKADNFNLGLLSDTVLSGAPVNVNARQVGYAVNFSDPMLQTVRVADAACVPGVGLACLTGDFTSLLTGTMGLFVLRTGGFPTSTGQSSVVELLGNIRSPALRTGLFANGDLRVAAALDHGQGDLFLGANQDLLIDAPINNSNGSISLEAGRVLQINAAVSTLNGLDISRVFNGFSAIPGPVSPVPAGVFVNANLTANSLFVNVNESHSPVSVSEGGPPPAPDAAVIRFAPGVTLRALGNAATTAVPATNFFGPFESFPVSSGILVKLNENASLDNLAGANVFVLEGLSTGWIIARYVPPVGSATTTPVTFNANGLQGQAITEAEFASTLCGSDPICFGEVQTGFSGYSFAFFPNPNLATNPPANPPGPVSPPAVTPTPTTPPSDPVSSALIAQSALETSTDPCVLNPSACADTAVIAGGGNAAGNGNRLLAAAGNNNRVDAPTVSAPLKIAAELVVAADARLQTLARAQEAKTESNKASAAKDPSTGKDRDVAEGAGKSDAKPADGQATEGKAAEGKAAEGKAAEGKAVEGKSGSAAAAMVAAMGQTSGRRGPSAESQALKKEAETVRAEARVAREEAKQVESEARRVEIQARKIEADARQQTDAANRAKADLKKAETAVELARTPQEKAAASRQLAAKREEAEARQIKAEVRQLEAEGKNAEVASRRVEAQAKRADADSRETRAESKALLAEARDLRSAGGRAVAEKRAEAKAVEADAKQVQAEVKRAEGAVKRLEAEVKKAEAQVRQAKDEARATAEKKLNEVRSESERAKGVVEQKKAEVESKVAEVRRKVEEVRSAEVRRVDGRKAEMATMFGMMASARMGKAGMEEAAALRQELKTEAFREALNLLDQRPNAVDLPPCGGNAVVCIPQGPTAVKLPPFDQKPTVSFLPQIQRKVAIMIGVNDYADQNIPSLDTALPDAQAVGEQLKDQFGYTVTTVPNATRSDIITSLNKLAREVGPNDSVTVYYAGHGYLNEKTRTGYWIPADGKATSPERWISNNDISRLLANIPAKQVLLVSDSCYSGSLTKEQLAGSGSIANPAAILAKRSVTVLSSGGDEPVSDEGKNGHSIFAYNFMNALKSVNKVDSASRVFQSVRTEVSKDAPQEPQYGGVLSANHQAGGEFLFEVRSFK